MRYWVLGYFGSTIPLLCVGGDTLYDAHQVQQDIVMTMKGHPNFSTITIYCSLSELPYPVFYWKEGFAIPIHDYMTAMEKITV